MATGPNTSTSCSVVACPGSRWPSRVGATQAEVAGSASIRATSLPSNSISASCSSSVMPCCTLCFCSMLTSEPMRTPSLRGLPTVTLASLAAIAWAVSSNSSSGTKMRRMAVHFWPLLTVISRTTSLTSRLKASLPSVADGSSRALLRLSASMLQRTESATTAGWLRMMRAVAAEPVKLTTSNGLSWSIRPADEPHTTDSAPTGSTPASTTSFTMRWVSQAVAVAGLMITGTPESRAGAAFSHRPQLGKLKALMNSATPRVGLRMCWVWNTGSLAMRMRSPSSSSVASPRASPCLA